MLYAQLGFRESEDAASLLVTPLPVESDLTVRARKSHYHQVVASLLHDPDGTFPANFL
jgi:hypothetical protein